MTSSRAVPTSLTIVALFVLLAFLVLAVLAFPTTSLAAGQSEAEGSTAAVRRILVVAGANSGGRDRVRLKYAVTDAEKVARVLTTMGGVEDADRILLRDPGADELRAALDDVARRIERSEQERTSLSSRGPADLRTEVLLYYSGHADESGLLLGGERLSYRELRDRMDRIEADVRITILDACASGAITRMKGGQKRQAFLVDSSAETQGYAFLTSSSANEAAQESDAIGSSFFTHYLVSGMHGAADVSGEGKVTLGEAYQFAFHETLASTTETQGGAQHPAYDIHLSGTGDVVMTDLRQLDAGLFLADDLDGRFYIRNDRNELVAELYKPAGRGVEIGLEPGTYSIHMERRESLFVSTPQLFPGDRLVLRKDSFDRSERQPTMSRGGAPTASTRVLSHPLAGRFRIELGIGAWGAKPRDLHSGDGIVTADVAMGGVVPQLRISRWMEELVSIGLSIEAMDAEVSADVSPYVSTRTSGVVSIMADVRRYFPLERRPYVRPYATVGVGAHIGSSTSTSVGPEVSTSATSQGAIALQLGGGVDVPLSGRFLLGAKAAYNLVSEFDEPVGGRRDYSGPEIGVGLSFVFGRATS